MAGIKMLVLTAFVVEETADPPRIVFEVKGAERDVPPTAPSVPAGRGKRRITLNVTQNGALYDLGAVVELPKVEDSGLPREFVDALAKEGLTLIPEAVAYYHWWRAFVPQAQGGLLPDEVADPSQEGMDQKSAEIEEEEQEFTGTQLSEEMDNADQRDPEDQEHEEEQEDLIVQAAAIDAQARADVDLIQNAVYRTIHPIGQVCSIATARAVVCAGAGVDEIEDARWDACLLQGSTVWSVTPNGLKLSKAFMAEAKARVEADPPAAPKKLTAAQKKKAEKEAAAKAEKEAADQAAKAKLDEEAAEAERVLQVELADREKKTAAEGKAAEKERVKAEKLAEKERVKAEKEAEKKAKALEAMKPKGKTKPVEKAEEELPPEPPAPPPVVEIEKPKGKGPKAPPPQVEVEKPEVRYPKHFYPGRVLRTTIRHAGAWGTCEYAVTCEVRADKCGFTVTHFQGNRSDIKVGQHYATSRALFVAMTGRPRPRTVIERVFDLDASDPLPE